MIKQGTDVLKEHKSNRLTFDAKLKQINFLNSRMYKRAENKYYPSVTTILQYMPKNKYFQSINLQSLLKFSLDHSHRPLGIE